jgi:FixJ family two-component response regulator
LTDVPVICIVDDDRWARSGLEDLILSLGYKARSFASAEQFVDSGAVAHAQCLITDLHMPGVNGLDLQNRLRRDGHRIPVIFVTAFPNETHRTRAIGDGALAFLAKPYNEQSLVDCINRAIAA